jgi:hypothetical protein
MTYDKLLATAIVESFGGFVSAARFSILALMFANLAVGQFSKDPVTNYAMRQSAGLKSIGDYVSDLGHSIGDLAGQKATIEIAARTSREAFWREYPNGPNLEGAGKRFATALQQKDYYYLMKEIIGRASEPTAAFIHQLSGGDIDGGIPRAAENTFVLWTQALWKNLGGGSSKTFELLFNQPQTKAEIEKAAPLYLDYRVRRDWEEFRAHGVMPPNVGKPFWDNVLLAVEMQRKGGIADPERTMDIYSYALDRIQRGDPFSTGCAAYLAKIVPKAPETGCSCIDKVFKQNLEPKDFGALHDKFDEQRFLLSSVSKVGLHEKVAACLH